MQALCILSQSLGVHLSFAYAGLAGIVFFDVFYPSASYTFLPFLPWGSLSLGLGERFGGAILSRAECSKVSRSLRNVRLWVIISSAAGGSISNDGQTRN